MTVQKITSAPTPNEMISTINAIIDDKLGKDEKAASASTADTAAALSSTLAIAKGGTGATTAANARKNLGISDGQLVDVGLIAPFAGTTVPSGWLACNGAAVSRTTYATLFARIGTTYGSGDGSTTFNLPNSGSKLVSDIITGNVPVFGNGKTVGFKSKNYTLGISINSNHLTAWSGLYNTNIGTQYSGSFENNTSIGITPEEGKSGIVAKVTATKTTVKYCIKY